MNMWGYLFSFESDRNLHRCQTVSLSPATRDNGENFSQVKSVCRKSLSGQCVLSREVGAWVWEESELNATNSSSVEPNWSTTWFLYLLLELVKLKLKRSVEPSTDESPEFVSVLLLVTALEDPMPSGPGSARKIPPHLTDTRPGSDCEVSQSFAAWLEDKPPGFPPWPWPPLHGKAIWTLVFSSAK